MSSPNLRRALAGVAAVLTVTAFAACGAEEIPGEPATQDQPGASPTNDGFETGDTTSTSEAPATVRTIVAELAGGVPVGGSRTEAVALDEPVRIEISGDTAEEIHVHTYDLTGDVAPSAPAVFELVADIPGVHEVEVHGSGQVIFELQVEP